MELPLFTATTARPREWQWKLIAKAIIPFVIGSALVTIYWLHAEPRRRLQRADYPAHSRSTSLQYCLVAALSIGIVAHSTLLALIIKYRNSQSVKAAQPVGQSIIALSGMVALAGGICLVLDAAPSFVTCGIPEPLIFLSMTTSGASIAGMAWRVERVVAPILMLGRRKSDNGKSRYHNTKLRTIKRRNTAFLTMLTQNPCSPRGDPNCIRQKVSEKNLVQLIGSLILPQFLLQILSLFLPYLRSYPASHIPYDLWCTRSITTPGPMVALGTIFTILPFISAVITTAKVEGGISIPPILNEASAIRNIVFYFTLFSISTAPMLAFDETGANLSTYISIYLLLGAVLPIAYFIVWPKLSPAIFSAEVIDFAKEITTKKKRSFLEYDGNLRREVAWELHDQGKIFKEIGMPKNSIKLYDEALVMWHGDEIGYSRRFTGNFSAAEIQGIQVAGDAYLVASLLTSLATLYESVAVPKAAKCYLKAIEVFEFSPAMELISEQSMIFRCFHSLFRLIREGELESDFSFERALTARFLQETKESNSYHHACALAMNAGMKFRSGLHCEALEEFAKMKKIYKSVEDSEAIREACGMDVCALAYARCALWHMEMGDEDNAVKQCEFVIRMLGNLQITDAKEMHAILTPIIAILGEKQTYRVNKLYEDRVVRLVCGSVPLFVRNARIVLAMNNDLNGMEDEVDWVLSRDNTELRTADHFYTSLGLSANTTAAEACLVLVQRSGSEEISRTLVLDKGLGFAMLASEKMMENDHVISSVANAKNQYVLTALKTVANKIEHRPSRLLQSMTSMNDLDIKARENRRTSLSLQLKTKESLPQELLLGHDTAAFVGLTHHSLASIFANALSEEPRRKWKRIYILYASDSLVDNFKPLSEVNCDTCHDGKGETDGFRHMRQTSQSELSKLLTDRVEDLRFYEITHHSGFFGAWFGWRSPGGYIHVSPSIWGVDVKECPSQNYIWELEQQPSHDYNAYKRGIENLLSGATPYAIPIDISSF